MPRILINALSSTAGGGITYLQNVLPRLERFDVVNNYVILVPPKHLNQYEPYSSDHLRIETVKPPGGALGRTVWGQTLLRGFVRRNRIGVMVSLGNFALLRTRVPQVLFNRNDLYFSDEFEKDLKTRGQRLALMSNRLKSRFARASIRQAQINIAPTAAFAERIRQSGGLRDVRFEILPFGFDLQTFTNGGATLTAEQLAMLKPDEDRRRLLYVSHYNYFRNFETLIRALPAIKEQVWRAGGKNVQLVLTTDIRQGAVYGGYDSTEAAKLIDQLGVRDSIAMLGPVEYGHLHQLYGVCDLFVCPSYSESFGHPLVEAMALGVPVVSANLPVHREVCGDAALYFKVFDEAELAEKAVLALTDADLAQTLSERGLERSKQFSWDLHVRKLIRLIERCLPYRSAISTVFPAAR
ncbi:MAG: glycosyltransferase family 4 protein [Blastocatellia bacterium]